MRIGAIYLRNESAAFVVWAPFLKQVELKIVSPQERIITLKKDKAGYWKMPATEVSPNTLYLYRLNGKIERPDPVSHFQPQGVHGPSQVLDHHLFKWEDESWRGRDLAEWIIYKLHVGKFTPEGTFEAIIPRLDELKEVGINAIELVPVAQFPGERNWGYDGAYPFAVQNSYDGRAGGTEKTHQRVPQKRNRDDS